MANIELNCDEATIGRSTFRKDEVCVCLNGVDEDEVLDQIGSSDVAHWAANHCLNEVIENAESDDVMGEFSWDEVKAHFNVDILDELSGFEDSVLEEIGWAKVREHFSDEIDAIASDIAQDLVERGVE